MLILIIGLILFLGMHSTRIFAEDKREAFIAKRGEQAWKGLYAVVSLIGFVLIIWGYGQGRVTAPVLYVAPFWMVHVVWLLMIPAIILFCMSGAPGGRIKAWVKHPQLAAVKIWAFSHLLVNGDLASIILFGSFLIWAVVDRISARRRAEAGIISEPEPGPVRNDVIAILIGLAIYFAFVLFLHRWLFGVSPGIAV